MTRWRRVVYVLVATITVTIPIWFNYMLGFGVSEHVLVPAVILVVGMVIAFCIGCIVGVCLLIVGAAQHRRYRGTVLLAMTLPVLSLTFVLPSFTAKPFKKYGASHRLQRLDRDGVRPQLLDMTREIATRHGPGTLDRADWPDLFEQLGATEVLIHGGVGENVDIMTSGLPIRSGWIIYTSDDIRISCKGIQVSLGIYRY